jgi:hypothetical protein
MEHNLRVLAVEARFAATRPPPKQSIGNAASVPPPLPYAVSAPPRNIYFVPAGKTVNGLGVASLVLGLVALLAGWAPFCGMGTLPISIIGFILGFAGLVTGEPHNGKGLPISGMIVCGAAILLPLLVVLLIGLGLVAGGAH